MIPEFESEDLVAFPNFFQANVQDNPINLEVKTSQQDQSTDFVLFFSDISPIDSPFLLVQSFIFLGSSHEIAKSLMVFFSRFFPHEITQFDGELRCLLGQWKQSGSLSPAGTKSRTALGQRALAEGRAGGMAGIGSREDPTGASIVSWQWAIENGHW